MQQFSESRVKTMSQMLRTKYLRRSSIRRRPEDWLCSSYVVEAVCVSDGNRRAVRSTDAIERAQEESTDLQ